MGTALVCLASGRLNVGTVDLDSDFGVGVAMAAGEERRWMLRRTRQVVTRTPMTTRKGKEGNTLLGNLFKTGHASSHDFFPSLVVFIFTRICFFVFLLSSEGRRGCR